LRGSHVKTKMLSTWTFRFTFISFFCLPRRQRRPPQRSRPEKLSVNRLKLKRQNRIKQIVQLSRKILCLHWSMKSYNRTYVNCFYTDTYNHLARWISKPTHHTMWRTQSLPEITLLKLMKILPLFSQPEHSSGSMNNILIKIEWEIEQLITQLVKRQDYCKQRFYY